MVAYHGRERLRSGVIMVQNTHMMGAQGEVDPPPPPRATHAHTNNGGLQGSAARACSTTIGPPGTRCSHELSSVSEQAQGVIILTD